MNRYLPIKIDIYDYLIDLRGNTWLDTGLPVTKLITVGDKYRKSTGYDRYFRLHICQVLKCGEKDLRTLSEYAFVTGKKVTVQFQGETYHPGDSDYELARLHDALETETALASLDEN